MDGKLRSLQVTQVFFGGRVLAYPHLRVKRFISPARLESVRFMPRCGALATTLVSRPVVSGFHLFLFVTCSYLFSGYLYLVKSPQHPSVVITCVTSPLTFSERGPLVNETWAAQVKEPDRFFFVTNQALNPQTSVGSSKIWVNPENYDSDWFGGSKLFISVILLFPLEHGEWLMLIDDDAFIQVRNLKDFIRGLDPRIPALYGQKACGGNLCGGGGALLSPALIHSIRTYWSMNSSDVTWAYDNFLSQHIENAPPDLGLKVVHHDGFRSQPPSHYKNGHGPPISNKPITFHYLDAKHQREAQERYNCGKCPDAYLSVYREYYGS